MSPGVLLVISPRMQKLTPNPGRDFARVRILAGLMTSDACANGSGGNSPSRQLMAIAGCQTVVRRYEPRTLASCRDSSIAHDYYLTHVTGQLACWRTPC